MKWQKVSMRADDIAWIEETAKKQLKILEQEPGKLRLPKEALAV